MEKHEIWMKNKIFYKENNWILLYSGFGYNLYANNDKKKLKNLFLKKTKI